MKKFLIILFLNLVVSNIAFGEEYYFKKCKLSEKVTADYLINIEKKKIYVTLNVSEGDSQNFTDGIKLITKNRIVSQIIQQKNKIFSTQYFLDADSKSVFRQIFKKESGIGLIRPEGPQKQSYCEDVKANWSEIKVEKDEKDLVLDEKLQVKSNLKPCVGEDIKNWSNCIGTYITKNTYKYTGEWQNGKQEGNGAEIWRDGTKYIGQYKNDKKNGKGTLTLANGNKYVGNFKDGAQHGQGTLILKSNIKYTGQFIKNQISKGTAEYPNKTKYIGEFKYNKPNGFGTLEYSNGGKFTGKFEDGYEYGEGVCIKPNGDSVNCIMIKKDNYLGDNKYTISFERKFKAKKNDFTSAENELKNYFLNEAKNECSITENFNISEQKIEIIEIDLNPAFAGIDGTNTEVILGIKGIVSCIWPN
tara:strand:- start:1672 stop:2919 length:1248 start_codon:yes stop_codon:yes gene_type:complete